MKLTERWKKLWKSYTVVFSGILVLLSAIQSNMFLIQPVMDASTFAYVSFTLAILTVVGRYIKQKSVEEDDDDNIDMELGNE